VKPEPGRLHAAREPQRIHVAVVHDGVSVRRVWAARTRAALLAHVVDYVGQQELPLRLPAEDASRVTDLLSGGQDEAAIQHYFGSVGRRWDSEFLVTDVVPLEVGSHADEAGSVDLTRRDVVSVDRSGPRSARWEGPRTARS
jgi:hypothetical protein